MCGICGIYFSGEDRSVDRALLERMCGTLRHRGPDDEGWHIDKGVGFGATRLSVIDLAGGHQPIFNEDGSMAIVFNGEIYNYRQLREHLEKRGHSFRTHSDTETIIHLYEEYGEDCVSRLNGMFAFAIWKEAERELFLARDRFGIKPLHYFFDGSCFIFASEIKAILQCPEVKRTVNFRALHEFLAYEYLIAPSTMFGGILKLPAGYTLTCGDGRIATRQYWDIHFQDDINPASEREYEEEIYRLLKESVRRRLVSDVPLGALLSGGIDSSSVVCLMTELMNQPVKTFSIGFEDKSYNELQYARIIAKQFETNHYELMLKPDVAELTMMLVDFLDEPFADTSVIPTYLVSKLAREHVTVALSGDGGDELFAGYPTYQAQKIAHYYEKLPRAIREKAIHPFVSRFPPQEKKKGLINEAKRFVEGAMLPEEEKHTRWMTFFTEGERRDLYSPALREELETTDSSEGIRNIFSQAGTNDLLSQGQYCDIKVYLAEDILVKVDRMSMAVSLETRVPFLDHEFAEFTARIPSKLKLRGLTTKHIFKKAMKGLLPRETICRPKEGFSIPVKNWLKSELKGLMLDTLAEEKIRRQGYFNYDYVDRLIRQHLGGTHNHAHKLWALIMFELWFERYIERGVQ